MYNHLIQHGWVAPLSSLYIPTNPSSRAHTVHPTSINAGMLHSALIVVPLVLVVLLVRPNKISRSSAKSLYSGFSARNAPSLISTANASSSPLQQPPTVVSPHVNLYT